MPLDQEFLDQFKADLAQAEHEVQQMYPEAGASECRRLAWQLVTSEHSHGDSTSHSLVPTIVKVSKDDDTTDFNQHIGPAAAARLVRLIGDPLAKGSNLPEPQDLSTWWDRVERVLASVNPNVRLIDINQDGCFNLGPIVLGDVAWKVVRSTRIVSWHTFRIAVEKRFGISAEDLEEALYAAKPAPGEASWAFICRVEDERAKQELSQAPLFQLMLPRLQGDFTKEVARLRKQRKMEGRVDLNWQDLVNLARAYKQEERSAAALGAKGKAVATSIASTAHMSIETETAGQEATDGAYYGGSGGGRRDARPAPTYSGERCVFCSELGLISTHPTKHCYVRPSLPSCPNAFFKQDAYDRRMQFADRSKLQAAHAAARQVLGCHDSETQTAPASDRQAEEHARDQRAILTPDGAAECVRVLASLNLGSNELDRLAYALYYAAESGDQICTVVVPQHHGDGQVDMARMQRAADMIALAESRREEVASGAFMAGDTTEGPTLRAVATASASSLGPEVVARHTYETPADQAMATGGRVYQPPVLDDVVSRLRVSYPILRAAKVDNVLRQLMLVMLIELNQQEKLGLVVPESMQVDKVTDDEFRNMKEALQGVQSAGNRPPVLEALRQVQREFEAQLAAAREAARLARQEISAVQQPASADPDRHMSLPKRVWEDLGLQAPPAAKKLPAGTSAMAMEVDANFHLRPGTSRWQQALARIGVTAEDLTPAGGPDTQHMAIHQLVEPSGTRVHTPDWAQHLLDFTDHLPYDSDLFMSFIGIGTAVTTAILDSGGARSMCDVETAARLGISWVPAKSCEYGCYQGVGGMPVPYQGVARDPLRVQFSADAVLYIPQLKIITHPSPLFIIGGDTLRAGRPEEIWDFRSLGSRVRPGQEPEGILVLSHRGQDYEIPLVCAPAVGAVRTYASRTPPAAPPIEGAMCAPQAPVHVLRRSQPVTLAEVESGLARLEEHMCTLDPATPAWVEAERAAGRLMSLRQCLQCGTPKH